MHTVNKHVDMDMDVYVCVILRGHGHTPINIGHPARHENTKRHA